MEMLVFSESGGLADTEPGTPSFRGCRCGLGRGTSLLLPGLLLHLLLNLLLPALGIDSLLLTNSFLALVCLALPAFGVNGSLAAFLFQLAFLLLKFCLFCGKGLKTCLVGGVVYGRWSEAAANGGIGSGLFL